MTGKRKRQVKRLLDISVASIGMVLTSPLILAAAVVVRSTMGRPVFFRQTRIGLDAEPFILLKFRTMRQVDGSRGNVDDEQRLTRVGVFLRSTSIDELPALWNVLRGEMSIVGPRPLLEEYLPLYSPEQAQRHKVRPGITGLAQSAGRNSLSWEKRFELDVEYVENWSLELDLLIVARTVKTVLLREGISSDSSVTMERFTGTFSEGRPQSG